MGHARAVADHVQSLVDRLEIVVDLDFHIIKLDLHAVEQRVVVGRAGGDLVEGVDHLDDAVEDALGDHETEIAGRGRERRRDKALGNAGRRASSAAHEIAEALHDDAAAEHVRQARDALAVAVGILEGDGEVLVHQQGKVRVFGVLALVLIAVAVDGHDAVGVLVDDNAVRIHAERAHQILELLGAVDDLALVQFVRQLGEDLGRQLDAHADVHAVRVRGDAQTFTDGFHPLAAAAADGDHAFAAFKALLAGGDAVALVCLLHRRDGRVEVEVDLFLQLVVDILQHDIVDVRAEVTHLGVEKVQPVLEAFLFQLGVGRGVQLRPLAAVGKVDAVHIAHQLQRLALADMLEKRAAELVGDVVLAVGERASAAEAAHNAADRALDTVLDGLAVDGAFSLVKGTAELDDRDLQTLFGVCQLIGRKNAAGAGADHNNIVFHFTSLLGAVCLFFRICKRKNRLISTGEIETAPNSSSLTIPRFAPGVK